MTVENWNAVEIRTSIAQSELVYYMIGCDPQRGRKEELSQKDIAHDRNPSNGLLTSSCVESNFGRS